jgi:hypothetical protein
VLAGRPIQGRLMNSSQFSPQHFSEHLVVQSIEAKVGQYVRRWKRWVLSGVRDVIVGDAFNWTSGGADMDASASLPTATTTLRPTG